MSISDFSSSSAARPGTSSDSGGAGLDAPTRAKAVAAAEKFESFFISEMLRQMRRSVREIEGEGGILKDRPNQDMLDFADQMTADALAGQHAFGIADLILRQILPPASVAPKADGLSSDKLQQAFKSPANSVALDK